MDKVQKPACPGLEEKTPDWAGVFYQSAGG